MRLEVCVMGYNGSHDEMIFFRSTLARERTWGAEITVGKRSKVI